MVNAMPATEEMDVERVRGIFRTWLRALAADSSAAVAAALVYEELSPIGRDAWLDAIAEDARGLDVPAIALYAPLLAVEGDAPRRERIVAAVRQGALPAPAPKAVRAWYGATPGGARGAIVTAPVYLSFVEVLGARFTGEGFEDFLWVPLAHALDPLPDVDVKLEPAPADDVVEELALALLAHERSGRPRPDAAQALLRYLTPVLSSPV